MTFIHRTKAKRVDHAGYSFASKIESAIYDQLWWRKKAGEIKEIQVQATVYLSRARIKYIPDFRVEMKDGAVEYHEAKGMESERFIIVKKLWRYYSNAPLYIWKGSYKKPVLFEVIHPEAGGANG